MQIIFAILMGLSVLAHEIFPRHEYHYFADTFMWIVWAYMLFYTFDNYLFGKHLITHTPLIASAAYLVVHHIAMFIGPLAENVVAAIFLIVVVVFGLKRFWEVLGDE